LTRWSVVVGLAACSGLLDVQSSNNVASEALDKPAAAPAIANGALSSLAHGRGPLLPEDAPLPYALTGVRPLAEARRLDLAVAAATGNTGYQAALTAVRARAEHAKAIWAKLHPVGPAVPIGGAPALIDDAAANADAAAALALAGAAADWKFRFSYSATTVDNYIGAWVPSRQEMRIGARYVNKATKDTLRDPITVDAAGKNVVDPEIRRAVVEFLGTSTTQLYSPLTVLSAREL